MQARGHLPLAPQFAAKWPEWFAVSSETVQRLGAVPGVQSLPDGTWIVHRTHLPLCSDYVHEAEPVCGIDLPSLTIRSWQTAGASFAANRCGSLIADDPRMGKTLTALLAHDPVRGSLVVIAPLSTRAVWRTWCARLWPTTPFVELVGREYDPEAIQAPILFVHYEIASAWNNLRRIETLIVDEAHLLARKTSKRTRAVCVWASQAARRIALTGTPLWNDVAGMYSVLALLNPGAWGSWTTFAARYASGRPGPHGFETGAPSNTDELRARLTEVVLRRTWDDVRVSAVPVERKFEIVLLTDADDCHLVRALAHLRATSTTSVPIGEVARIRRLLGDIKAPIAALLARMCLDKGRSVVVWTWHKDVAQALAVRLGSLFVTGDMSAYQRENVLDAWRARAVDYPTPLVATIAVAQVGIDLSQAADTIFAELDWTCATLAQAEFRTYSPTRSMRATYLAVDHPIERAVVEVLKAKATTGNLLGMIDFGGAHFLSRAFGGDDVASLERLRHAITGA